MPKTKRHSKLLKWGTVALVLGFVLAPVSYANTCYGTLFHYFESSAYLEIVGSKVACPGFPDEIDTDENGSYVQTPFFTTQTVICPCGSGGSGGGGGGEDEDSEDF